MNTHSVTGSQYVKFYITGSVGISRSIYQDLFNNCKVGVVFTHILDQASGIFTRYHNFRLSLYSATPSSASSIISIINRVIPGRKTITLKMPRYPWSKYTNYTSLWRTLWYSRYVTRSYSTSLLAISILPHMSFVIIFLRVSQIGLIRLWFGLITTLAVAKEICRRQHHS